MEESRICFGCMSVVDTHGGTCPICGFNEITYQCNPRAIPLHSLLNNRYKIGKVLGEGGFGLTYIAYDTKDAKPVAIKEYFPSNVATRDCHDNNDLTLHFFKNRDEKAYINGLEKYTNEARILKKYNGLDGIVSTIDFFEANETAYIVMEYIDGITLKEYLETNGTLSPKEAIELMMPVLKSLEEIHKDGIIHRDISPDNIMIGLDGSFKLIDFGAARFTNEEDNKSMTIILKRGFAPEEQYRSKGVQGPWTDVYALCATLYKAITNKVPPEAMDRLIEDELKPLSSFHLEMPEGQIKAIMKGLKVRAKDRYQTVEELMLDLDIEKNAKEKNIHMIAVFKEKDGTITGYRLYDMENNKIMDISTDDLITRIVHKRLKVSNLIVYNRYVQPVGGNIEHYPVMDIMENLIKNDNYYFVEHSLSFGYKCITYKGTRCYFDEIEMLDHMKKSRLSNPDKLELFISKRNKIATTFVPSKQAYTNIPKARTVTEEVRRKKQDAEAPTKTKLSLSIDKSSLSVGNNAISRDVSTQMRLKLLNNTHLTDIADK